MLYDKDIREPLFEFLEDSFDKVRIIEEKNMGSSRADAFMVMNEALVGIEIKSDADSYTRLSHQTVDYDLFFDYNIIAVGTSHASHVAEHIPDHWGIITVDEVEDGADCYLLREMKPNPASVIAGNSADNSAGDSSSDDSACDSSSDDSAGEINVVLRNQLSLLWRPELAHIQEINNMPAYSRMSKANVQEKILNVLAHDVLKKCICDELFERDYLAIAEQIKAYRQAKNPDKKVRKKRKRYRRKKA